MSLLAAWLTTFAVCVAGSIIPLINTEVYLVSAVALSPDGWVIPLVLAATFGQMTGKVVMYYAGRGVVHIPYERVRTRMVAMQARLQARPRAGAAVLLASATVGLPPLYVVSIACGAVRMNLLAFFVIGTVGRLVHFAAVAAIPQLVKHFTG
jgi:membrane protein YqaA with SNARE-associated domain